MSPPTKWVSAVAAAALAALVLSVSLSQSAPLQRPKPPRWEYRVVVLETSPGRTVGETEDRATRRVNELGADGWEYADRLADKPNVQGVYLLFKRPKL